MQAIEGTQNKPAPRGGTTLTYTGADSTYLVVGKLALLGGADRQPAEFDDAWLLKVVLKDDGTHAFGWKKVPVDSTFRARTGHSAVLYKRKIYIYGGQSFKQNVHTSELWVFDCASEKFHLAETKNTPPPRNSHGACVDENTGLMYVYGGANDQGLLKDFYEYFIVIQAESRIHGVESTRYYFSHESCSNVEYAFSRQRNLLYRWND